MKKFMVFYNSPKTAMELMKDPDSAESKAMMVAWMAWARKCGEAVVDLGMPLGGSMTITKDSKTESVTPITGYSIMKAENMSSVIEMFNSHPHLEMAGNSIDIYEILMMPGM